MIQDREKERLLALFSPGHSLRSGQDTRSRAFASAETLIRSKKVSTRIEQDLLLSHFRNTESPQPVSVERYMQHLAEHLLPHAINLASPRCLGHMTTVVPDFVRELDRILDLLNQNLVKADASRSFTLLERQTIAMVHRLIYGFGDPFYDEHVQSKESSLGIVTSGGTLSNITALWIARNACFKSWNGFSGVEEEGMLAALGHSGYEKAVVIGSSLMHYSIEKAVSLLGIGARNLIRIPVDQRNRVNTKDLRRVISNCKTQKARVIAIVGVAGSTDCGSVDPLDEMADIAHEAQIHFHVDAAWGAPFLFSPVHRRKLAGIERADSVTADFHKQMCLPLGSSMLLLRDPEAAKIIEKQTGYILHEGAGDLGRRSLEGSRRATILNINAALNIIGHEGYAYLTEENISKARFMADVVKQRPEFELLFEPETNIVLYRYIPASWREALAQNRLPAETNLHINAINENIQKAQYEAGRTYVSRTKLNGAYSRYPVSLVALRAVLANPLTGEEDIEMVLDDQSKLASELTV